MTVQLLRGAALLAALSPLAYYLLATYCGWQYFRKRRSLPPLDPSFTPPVSVLKPVRGLDREGYENFASFCRLDYPEYELLFAVSDADDPVIPLIEKLRRDFPQRSIRLLTDVPSLGANPKVNNLCKLVQEAKHDLLVIADSDVRVEPGYLREVAAHFADPRVGAVTAFFRGLTPGGMAAELEGLALSTETVPNALVAQQMEGKIQFAFGWTMATTKQCLKAIGGFEAIVNYHSDDFELGNRIAAHGFRIELTRQPVWMVFPRETIGEYLRHEMRWSIGLRNVRPAGYIGLALTFGLPWAVLAAAVAPSAGIAAAYLLAYLALRLTQVWTSGAWGLDDPVTRKSLWLVPLRDAVSFVVWVAGFFSDKVTWRGRQYRVKRGLLVPLTQAAGTGRKDQRDGSGDAPARTPRSGPE
ncbi:MAG: bacteriohopanetetrol glucosamine biosynthesis glycosyltransferase HpnI [Acidobacteriia bacterium]|nr:bacteriohopanetetrol glucosamine biosynthesis glycosyltransferase HpnI [Terriglobia bacterium]